MKRFPVGLNPSMIIVIIMSSVNIVLSQQQNGNTSDYSMYIKAGYEFADFSNGSIFSSGRTAYQSGGVHSVIAAIGIEYTKRLALELQFKNMEEVAYGYDKEAYLYLPDGTKYYLYGFGSMKSGYVNLRANYFVNEDRRENPIYFIGALIMGIQNVENTEAKEYAEWTEFKVSKFSRFVIGPEAGLGIYFDFGVFNFAVESTFSSRITFGSGDKKYAENSITLNFSPVLRF